MKPYNEGFWVGVAIGIVCAVIVFSSVLFTIKKESITTLPDGRKFIQLNSQNYWVQEWEKESGK